MLPARVSQRVTTGGWLAGAYGYFKRQAADSLLSDKVTFWLRAKALACRAGLSSKTSVL
ncbi:hypothetical protein D3C78_1499000 [compost metagenome]